MLAQTTARDTHARGNRSQTATGSDPQTAFAHAHIPSRRDRKLTRYRNTRHTPNDWDGALRPAAVCKEG
jgi:hypothetical protein